MAAYVYGVGVPLNCITQTHRRLSAGNAIISRIVYEPRSSPHPQPCSLPWGQPFDMLRHRKGVDRVGLFPNVQSPVYALSEQFFLLSPKLLPPGLALGYHTPETASLTVICMYRISLALLDGLYHATLFKGQLLVVHPHLPFQDFRHPT